MSWRFIRMHRIGFALVSLLTSHVAVAQAPTVVIRGEIVDSDQQRPLAFAIIALTTPAKTIGQMRADSTGRFAFSITRPTDRLTLRVRYLDFIEQAYDVSSVATRDTVDLGRLLISRIVRYYPDVVFIYPKRILLGTGLAVGALGAEIRSRSSEAWASSIGVGVAGVGGRLVREIRIRDRWRNDPCISGEFVFAPWRWGPFDAAGGVGAMIGARAVVPFNYDVAVGYAWLYDGTWWGRRSLPVLRLAVGW